MASTRMQRWLANWIFKWQIHLRGVSHLWDVSQTCSAMCTHRNELFAFLFISVLPGSSTDARWRRHLFWIQHIREHKKKNKQNETKTITKQLINCKEDYEDCYSSPRGVKKKENKTGAIILIFFKKIICFCETLFILLLIFTILTLVFYVS